ncbi:MAG TPA: hypothetical protein DHV30_00870, partial [Balneola sp.]|nr:hypothetical protein [Balneola sp.]
KQTLYAKEQSEWAKIEDMFNGTFTGDTETMIISRHPVDVLRMSDIGTIRSCHSETGEYSYCAVAESLGNGLIAYLVNTNELERFLGDDSLGDYDDKEIFYDKQRDIEGIIAHSRVRLRKFYDQDTGEYFTAPEQRLYGVQSNTFRDSVREWSWDRQQDQFVKRVDGKKTLSLPDFDNLQRMGGSYEDTRDGETLNRFFSQSGKKIDVYRNYANVEKVLDPFEEEQGAVNVDQVQVQLDQINDQYNNLLPNVGVHGEVEQFDLDRVTIYGSAGFTFV